METYDHLKVDPEDLANALESHLDEGSWLLDLESGEVILAASDSFEDEPGEEDYEDPEKFLPILPMPSRDAFRIMEAFVETLPDGEGSRSLAQVLGHPRPFRGFKDTLLEFPDLRERWFKFHDARMLEKAQEWLEDNLPGARLGLG
jgi:hypothetical protein